MSEVHADASLAPTARETWRVLRAPLAVLAAVLVGGLAIGWLGSSYERGQLDPASATPAGSRALAQLLGAQGVSVVRVLTTEEARARAGADATLLVTMPALLQEPQLEALRASPAARIVLLGPNDEALRVLAPGLKVTGATAPERSTPGCELPAAQRAGAVDGGGALFGPGEETSEPATFCYPSGDGSALAVTRHDGHEVVALGNPRPLTNDRLDDRGNAALALNLLGAKPRLVWYLPSLGDASATDSKSPFALLPRGWLWGVGQVAVAVALLALWRARRLGPVVAEPLPIVVRAAETVEGRARLYQRAKTRDRAAELLRFAVRQRLAPLVGQPVQAPPAALVDAVAAHTGRQPGEVGELLYGSVPGDDDTLVRLADDLDALEREVRRS